MTHERMSDETRTAINAVKEMVDEHKASSIRAILSVESHDKEISLMKQGFEFINTDLKEIKKAITSTTVWLILTLLSVLISASLMTFYVGSWKGGLDEQILQIRHRIEQLENGQNH